jgi:hypothetical protein
MGPKWSLILAVLSSLLTTLVDCIFFLLASDILYEMFGTFSRTFIVIFRDFI